MSIIPALEKATGYPAESWAFPKKYKNPYLVKQVPPELYPDTTINSKQEAV